MKRNLIAILLALTVMSWAQSTTPTQTPAPDQKSAPADTKPACPCCEKMSSADHGSMHKDMQACMHHDGKDGKETSTCCGGKDAKDAASCCGKDAKACSKDGKTMACCTGKDGDAASHGCCGGNSCGKHDHHEHATPGN